MQRIRLLIVALVAVAVTACSGQSANSSASASAAPASVGAPSATTAAATEPAVAESTLPVYPGASKVPGQSPSEVAVCGHKMSMVMYKVADSVDTIAAWYADKMPDSKQIKTDHLRDGLGMHNISVVSSDGATAAVVLRMIMPPALAVKMHSGTTLGLVTYDPPFTQDELSLYMRASNGDEAAKKEAMDVFKDKCGKNFTFGSANS